MQSHDIDFQIFEEDVQLVEIELDTGETVIAGAWRHLVDGQGISFETEMGARSEPDRGFLGKLAADEAHDLSGGGGQSIGENILER